MKTLAPPKRIVVMRYRFIGDTLLTVPFLRNLRQAFPDAVIDLLAESNSGELLDRCPYIDNLIYLDKEAPSFLKGVDLLKRGRYDTAFVLKRSFSSALMAKLAGIPQRVGFDTEMRGWLLTHPVHYDMKRHEVDCFLDVLAAVQIPASSRGLEYWPDVTAEQKITAAFAPYAHKMNILIHATSSNPAKQWTGTHWQALVRQLLVDGNVMLHAVGAAPDARQYVDIAAVAKEHLVNWCGKTTLDESMALIARMQLVVGVDSGTLHMASALGVPVVALFGPMDENKWQPMEGHVVTEHMACRPCNLKTPCPYDFRCMTTLSAERVYEKVKMLWPASLKR